jgi:DNA-binding MarR family transcriptional regulator
MRKRFDDRATKLVLTRAQWRVSAHIGLQQGINQTALADILEVENITLGRHIDRLQNGGWVQHHRDPMDRRAWRLYVTKKAHPTLLQMQHISLKTRAETLQGFSPAESDALLNALLRLKKNLIDQGPKIEDAG